MVTSSALAGKRPLAIVKDSKGAGTSPTTNAGACPPERRLPCRSRNVAWLKMPPAALATPGTARTCASVASLIGEVSARVSRPSVSAGLTTTSWPLLAVVKIPAKEWLIVSVRMYVPAISATPSAIAIAVSSTRSLRCMKPRSTSAVISPPTS